VPHAHRPTGAEKLAARVDNDRLEPPVPQVHRSALAGFRFPPEVIRVAVRRYLRYGLSYRDVEKLLAERGVEVDHVIRVPVGAAIHPAVRRRRPPAPARDWGPLVRR